MSCTNRKGRFSPFRGLEPMTLPNDSIVLAHLVHEELAVFLGDNRSATLFVLADPDDELALLHKPREDRLALEITIHIADCAGIRPAVSTVAVLMAHDFVNKEDFNFIFKVSEELFSPRFIKWYQPQRRAPCPTKVMSPTVGG